MSRNTIILLIYHCYKLLALLYITSMDLVSECPRGKVTILGRYSIGHSKQKNVYVHVSYSERFPRYSYFTVQYTVHCTDEQHTMSCKVLQSELMLTVEFSKMYCIR
jgi:hypothetical protein